MRARVDVALALVVGSLFAGCSGSFPDDARGCAASARAAVASGDLPRPAGGEFWTGYVAGADSEEPSDHCWLHLRVDDGSCRTFLRRAGDETWGGSGAVPDGDPCAIGTRFELQSAA